MSPPLPRIQINTGFVLVLGTGYIAHKHQGRCQVVAIPRPPGQKSDRMGKRLRCKFVLIAAGKHDAQGIERQRIDGRKLQRP